MTLRKFDKNKANKKLNNKNNKNTKITAIVVSLTILIGAIIYFSFARFESNNEYHLIDGIIKDNRQQLNNYLFTLNNSDITQNDQTQEQNTRFIGTNPNNYVLFGCSDEKNPTIETCELWRIIGVFEEHTHGLGEKYLTKIVKYTSVDINETADTTNVWGDTKVAQKLNSNAFPYAASNLVETAKWFTGNVKKSDLFQKDVISTLYDNERYVNYIWSGKVGLPYLSDYYYSVGGNNIDRCLAERLTSTSFVIGSPEPWSTLEQNGLGYCVENAWLLRIDIQYDISESKFSMTKNSEGTDSFLVASLDDQYGAVTSSNYDSSYQYYPTVYLKEKTYCLNCDEANVGTKTNPYKITF